MCVKNNAKSILCELTAISLVNDDIFIMYFNWEGHAPKAGQFFMLKPERSGVFLPRPISIFEYNEYQKSLKFLISIHGKGTKELANLRAGEKVYLTGPFGNSWSDFLPESGKFALIGGSAGVAPLAALIAEKPDCNFHLFAGFKKGFRAKDEENAVFGGGIKARKIIITADDGRNAVHGNIVDQFYDPKSYDAAFACGPLPMLKAVKQKCESNNVPCFISMESRMACGCGACLGCTINTVNGNKRCCTDGPIFPSREILFND